ncbi:universal stress protein [Candidatus Uabimicrobium sp. HlEnr_7]|uniref:universal stress protein n=1 Tax=Candidatus Uabimicrobium helgolandensis TaxID=3095367 RepID=UPI0035574352
MEAISEIFLATDFGEHSQKAEQKAMIMAKKLHVPLSIVYVLNNKVMSPGLYYEVMDKHPEWLDGMQKEMRKKCRSLISELYEKLQATGQKYIFEGNPKKKIVEFTKKYNVELLVMGKRGGKEGHYIGSVSEYVTEYADCSVLLVP